MRELLLLTVVAELAACTMREAPPAHDFVYKGRASDTCVAEGWQPGTPGFSNCVVRMSRQPQP
jgi:hypothetical protein